MACVISEKNVYSSLEYLWVHSIICRTFSMIHMYKSIKWHYMLNQHLWNCWFLKSRVFLDIQHGNSWFFNFCGKHMLICSSVYLSIHTPIHPFLHPFIPLSFLPSLTVIKPPTYPSIYPLTVHLNIYSTLMFVNYCSECQVDTTCNM